MKFPTLPLSFAISLALSGCTTPPAAQKFQPSDHETIVTAAGEKVLRGDYAGALIDLNRVIAANPQNASAYSWRAGIHLRKQNFDEALRDLDTSLGLRPSAGNLLTRAQIKSDRNDRDGALADIEAALKIDPNKSLAYKLRGAMRFSQADYSEAVRDFDEALRLVSGTDDHAGLDSALILLDRGRAKEMQTNYDGAIDDYTRAVEICPEKFRIVLGNTPQVRREQALLLKQGKNATPASMPYMHEVYTKVLKSKPTDWSAWQQRGKIKVRAGDMRGGLDDYANALKYAPADTSLYQDIGIAHQILGELQEALNAYDKHIASAREEPVYGRIFRALLLEQMGRSTVRHEIAGRVSSWQGTWEKSLGHFLIGSMPSDELLQLAAVGQQSRLKECEALYYIGIRHLLDGDKVAAKTAFERCVKMTDARVSERLLARAALVNLGSTETTSLP